jgi:cytochrome c oxidase subunit 5a
VNDFPTAVRIFEGFFPSNDFVMLTLYLGIKAKTENKNQYEQYLEELKSIREDLGIPLKEDMYP